MAFLTTDEAREQILGAISRIGHERVSLAAAVGRTLARPIIANENSPPFSNSARDGFALRWEDIKTASQKTPASLLIAQTIHAGEVAREPLRAGEAAKIMTGAPVPQGADTIVMREDARQDGERVIIEGAPDGQGAWVRHEGSFVSKGSPLLQAGATLRGSDIGVLAMNNNVWVEVARRPVVAIVSAGDELVDPGQPRGPSQIINANAPMLQALVEEHGGVPIVFPTQRDDLDAIRQTYRDAIACADLVVSSGGVSMGDRDFTRLALDELSEGMTFWKISMKPGKPLAFGVARDTPLIGLPGNPASSFVCFHQFVRPAMETMMGISPQRRQLQAHTTTPIASTPKRRHYVSGTILFTDEGPRFTPIPDQDSGNPAILAGVNALAIVELGIASLEAKSLVQVELLRI